MKEAMYEVGVIAGVALAVSGLGVFVAGHMGQSDFNELVQRIPMVLDDPTLHWRWPKTFMHIGIWMFNLGCLQTLLCSSCCSKVLPRSK